LAVPHGSALASNTFEAAPNHQFPTAPELSFLRHRQKITAHAERKLSTNSQDLSACARELRAFLRLEDERLRVADRMGAGGLWIAKARSFVLDVVVGHALQQAIGSADADLALAIVALGGYGRSELAPFSDLDLLFLTSDRAPAEAATVIDQCQHLLWDAGITVSQKCAAVSACMPASRNDPHFQTALVNIRLIAGNAAVYRRLTAAINRERETNGALLLDSIRQERDQRYAKRGTVIYLQEPNVKESAGGLRDFHTALWAAYARSGLRSVEELVAQGLIDPADCQTAVDSYDFLLRVRLHAHWITKRKTDHLSLDLQESIARKMGYDSAGHLLASEKFMRAYYRHARELHHFSDGLFRTSIERPQNLRRWFSPKRPKRIDNLFSLKDGELNFDGAGELFAGKPGLLFRAVSLAQANNAVFSQSLHAAIRQNLSTIDHDFRGSREASRAFLSLLQKPAEVGRALRLMHDVDLLGRYLPEFARVSMLIQHDLYHQFTVDEHTLRAIEELDKLHHQTDRKLARYRTVLDEIEDVSLLYLALLLHDLGKTGGRGHIPRGIRIAERICARLGLDLANRKKVVLLVKHHVLMAHLSQRRDLREPRLVKHLARQGENLDVLNMLFLLTYADLNAVGAGVWSDWKGDLLEELYVRTRAVFTGEAGPPAIADKRDRLKGRVIESLIGTVPISEVERHFALSADRYIDVNTVDDIALHLRLAEQLNNDSLACWWCDRESFATELTICTRDRHGLFADITGALAATGIDILSADVNTREDGMAIDRFMLQQATTHRVIDQHRWNTIESALRAAIDKQHDVASLVERWRTRHAPKPKQPALKSSRVGHFDVWCDNEIAETMTVAEVRAPDEHGLAYKIARVLTEFGLDIVCARIATEKSDALDVFYVTNADGAKLNEMQIEQLTAALTEALGTGARETAIASA
jgi:[protein-PII] uridylyltransferase